MGAFGRKCKAYLDENPLVGFFVDYADDGKDKIQVGDTVHLLVHREPADYDNNGPGRTYCWVKP